jgi:hypothetical protein
VKGGSPATGSLVLRRPPNSSTEITLKSSDSAVVNIPAQVTIPPGQDKTTFQLTTKPVSTETSVEISAVYEGLIRSIKLKVIP